MVGWGMSTEETVSSDAKEAARAKYVDAWVRRFCGEDLDTSGLCQEALDLGVRVSEALTEAWERAAKALPPPRSVTLSREKLFETLGDELASRVIADCAW